MFEKSPLEPAKVQEIKHFCKVYTYPDGSQDLIAASRAIFQVPGWESRDVQRKPRDNRENPRDDAATSEEQHEEDAAAAAKRQAENQVRSMRRARAKVRRLALANEFRWFVTLTLNQEKVDRMDGAAVVKKLNIWCSNMVQRQGLKYILVPERHKKGGIHFHGFFNDCVQAVDSGHTDKDGHKIYNLPEWDLGFTTAIELYGEYSKAVAYVCKYIGKQGEKPAGRWYYSGGGLFEPKTDYVDISAQELMEDFGGKAWSIEVPGALFAGVNGIAPL